MKKELYMMFKAGSIWTFGMAYIIIDLLWLSFWDAMGHFGCYKSNAVYISHVNGLFVF